ncbi:3-deoxy-7-phosphoheptulonate synthase [Nocardiopsis rhodophaea]|uniref:3-deoxy-7-phosphoheptulonate synthase n=1 Tax=Nocardiopsis rhodophaea TaxID=280238 RepID=UPI0031DCF50A
MDDWQFLRKLRAAQQPEWPDASLAEKVVVELAEQPALVPPRECDRLRGLLAAVARGEGFLLHGGDCAETFTGATATSTARKVDVLTRLASDIARGSDLPVVTVGRIAGQYGKPRSASHETRDGTTLPVYRGDAVNGFEFTAEARRPDPRRLLRAHHASAATLDRLPDGLFSSHEALLLEYETALARRDPATASIYGTSGHLLWIGDRTRQFDGAHVAFAARVRNPIGVKLGPVADGDAVVRLADRLNPEREPGRLTLITRMGATKIRDLLPPIVERVTADGIPVIWACDPMHGNTVTAPTGHKTRSLEDVFDEVTGFFEVHRSLGTHPGGLHLEVAGEDVTECVGGDPPVAVADLQCRYETACDPRLNPSQARQLSALVEDLFAARLLSPSSAMRRRRGVYTDRSACRLSSHGCAVPVQNR